MGRMLARILVAVGLVACSACSTTNMVGERGDGSTGRDAGAPARPRVDECGNGLDDDGNGRIDDGCPCGTGETQSCFMGAVASRHVGACTDGVQTCRLTGVEWGDWGDSPCVGGIAPATEQCDGLDHDCDGARDEDCPCTAGMTQTCGLEFLTAPCRGGAQSCRADGTWSACEGAIGPTPDVCDGTDNDCDGTTDEGCGCVPEPEICRDGIDNDCDGEVDEPACMPDWPPADGGAPSTDAGVPDVDAGPRECTGRTDLCLARPGTLETTSAVGRSTFGDGFGPQLATDGTHLLVMELVAIPLSGPYDLHFLVLAADGTIEHDVLVQADVTRVGDIVWTGTEAALVWWGGAPSYQAMYALLRLDATIATGPTAIDPAGGGSGGTVQAAVGPDGLAFAWARYSTLGSFDASSGWFQRRNADGSPRGPLVALGAAVDPTSMEAFGPGFVVGTRHYLGSVSATPQFQSQIHHVTGDAVTWSVDLPLDTHSRSSGAVVAASCDRVLACWRDNLIPPGVAAFEPHIQRCQAFDAAGVAVAAAPTVLLDGSRYGNLADAHYLDVVWADGQFLVRAEATYPASFPTSYDTRSEWYVALSTEGAILWTQGTERRGVGFAYEYGEIAWDGACAVELMQGTVGATLSTYDWKLRRTCTTSCP